MKPTLAWLASELVLPPGGPFMLLLAAFLLRPRLHRTSIAMALVATCWLLLFSMPGMYHWLRSPWPDLPSRIAPPYPPADAIVVLGGGRYIDAPEYGGDTAGPSTLERLRYAAKLMRETGAPSLLSGGRPRDLGSRAEAEVMADILRQEYGLQVRWVEGASTDTRENAMLSAPLLRADGIARIYLVTHESHMARAQSEFERQGFTVIPMPTGFTREDDPSFQSWVPSFRGLSLCRSWLHEQLAPLSPF